MNINGIPNCKSNQPKKMNTTEISKYLSKCLKDNLKDNEVIYVTADGSVYISTKYGASLKKVGEVISGFDNLADLKRKVPNGSRDKYYWTDDGNLYIYKNNEYINLIDSKKYILKANEISFDNSNSTLKSIDVQEALIELYNELVKKANENHNHELNDINGLIQKLDSLNMELSKKSDVNHTHEINDINKLPELLNNLVKKEDLENEFNWSNF